MLDLKLLEEKLDLALSIETSESLTNWLQEKRLKAFLNSLGEGSFSPISKLYGEYTLVNQKVNFDAKFNSLPFTQDYTIAA